MSIDEAKMIEFRPKGGELFTTAGVQKQLDFIKQIMRENMKDGHHFGVIPGTKKPTLLKPGAELLCLAFRLAPKYEVTKTDLANGHREYEVICELSSIVSGELQGEGVGMASTMETKHRYRWASKVCPACGADKIFKGKEEYGGGWYCNTHKGGCGAKFQKSDPQITSQETGRRENNDVADQFNTILKMAKKRAHTDAVFTVTACSDIFQQEDVPPEGGGDDQGDDPESEYKGKKFRTKAEAEAAKNQTPEDDKPPVISETVADALTALAKEHKWTDYGFNTVIGKMGFKDVKEITIDRLDDIKATLIKKPSSAG